MEPTPFGSHESISPVCVEPDELADMETPDLETSGDEYATRFSGNAGRYFLEIQERAVIDLLKRVPGRTVLDVGGAHGQIAIPLRREGYEVTVLGSSTACHRNLAKRLGRDDVIRFVAGDLLNLPFRDGSFDFVVSFRLLPHVDRWNRLIEELARVARFGVIVDFPTVWSVNLFYAIPLPPEEADRDEHASLHAVYGQDPFGKPFVVRDMAISRRKGNSSCRWRCIAGRG